MYQSEGAGLCHRNKQVEKPQWLKTAKVISCSHCVYIVDQLLFSLYAKGVGTVWNTPVVGQRVNSKAEHVLFSQSFLLEMAHSSAFHWLYLISGARGNPM